MDCKTWFWFVTTKWVAKYDVSIVNKDTIQLDKWCIVSEPAVSKADGSYHALQEVFIGPSKTQSLILLLLVAYLSGARSFGLVVKQAILIIKLMTELILQLVSLNSSILIMQRSVHCSVDDRLVDWSGVRANTLSPSSRWRWNEATVVDGGGWPLQTQLNLVRAPRISPVVSQYVSRTHTLVGETDTH